MKPFTILAVRDPDGEVDIRLWYRNTEETDEAWVVVVDAGAGHEMADWMETARSIGDAISHPAPYEAIREAYRDPPGAQYIRGWIDRDNVEKQWVDTSLTDIDGKPTVLTMDEVEWLGLDGTLRS